MVGAAAFCISRLLRLHCLLHLGCSSGPALQVWSVSFSDVFTGIVWRSFACMVWNKTGVDAGMGYSGDADTVGPWRFPTSTFGCARWACGPIGGSSSGRVHKA